MIWAQLKYCTPSSILPKRTHNQIPRQIQCQKKFGLRMVLYQQPCITSICSGRGAEINPLPITAAATLLSDIKPLRPDCRWWQCRRLDLQPEKRMRPLDLQGRVVLIINGLSSYYRLTIPVMYSRPYLTPLPAIHREWPGHAARSTKQPANLTYQPPVLMMM